MAPGSEVPFEKLTAALAAWEKFVLDRRAGLEESEAEFLARHPDLRSILEPMLEEAPPGSGMANQLDDGIDFEGFGPYRIIQQIGSGGMGEVYLAEQREPVARRVALKVIKLGMDTRQVLARFEVERQALALMNHDNIAKVFDAGTTPRGQPYFVMEHVAGLPIHEHCDKLRLGTVDRLRLFQKVCEGVQHAHQKGILHRDLKPSNILVSVDQGRAVPKIIDFGLARATGPGLGSPTLVTRHGQAIGTPQYMSPEQAEMSSQDVDTRTDIYSLGVTLYQLLIGELPWTLEEVSPPQSPQRWQKAFDLDLQRPSTRLTTKTKDQMRCAELRQTSPRLLLRDLRGDLDWVTMKALERDRNRRYSSAAEFAADIERHINHEPVLAGPPRVGYRVAKFVRRNRWQVVAAALLLLSLVAGVIGTSIGFVAADQRAREAARAQKDAEQWLDRYNLLAIGPALTRAGRDAAELFPPTGDLTPRVQEWLAKHADTYAARMAAVTRALEDLRGVAPKRTDAEIKRDREEHPVQARARSLASMLGNYESQLPALKGEARRRERELLEERLAGWRARLAKYQEQVEERRTWRLPDENTQFLHDSLADLHRRLEAFGDGQLKQVRELHEWVLALPKRTYEDHKDLWAKTQRDIASSERYEGLKLEIQLGLVPLGADPKTGLMEFVHLRSGTPGKAIPSRGADGALRCDRDSGIIFVLLPGGESYTGAQRSDPAGRNFDRMAQPDEQPVRKTLLDPFFLGKYEVTQAQWKRLTHGREPSAYRAAAWPLKRFRVYWTHPVENVNWTECDRLLRREGLTLPTEVQWEYACRAGTSSTFFPGTDVVSLRGHANFSDATAGRFVTWAHDKGVNDGYLVHSPVGTFSANAFGLHDMHGNVYEWCLDPRTNYQVVARRGDGLRSRPGLGNRLARGGSYQGRAYLARSAARNAYTTDERSAIIGVRAARQVDR